MLIMQGTGPRLQWEARRRLWIIHTDTESLYVDEATYHRILVEQLAKRGIEWKTWTQYIGPAEAAWKRQCYVENCLKTNVGLWREVEGVKIITRR